MRKQRIQANNISDLWSVYALSDSRSPEVVRYVGISKNLAVRLRGHKADKSRSHKACWVRSVIAADAEIVMAELRSGLSWDEATAAEIATIAEYRAAGARLTNGTDGGEGVPGHVASNDLRQRRAEFQRGRQHTPETRAKISAGQKGNRRPPETGARIADAKRMTPPKPGTFKGVYARGNRWVANIYIDGKQKFLGTFAEPRDAALEYDKVATALWGQNVCLNFPAAA